tara:strand:+ start:619 stop:1962 length:1344 start_codon:yes stop_codon:yes gene_type:complete
MSTTGYFSFRNYIQGGDRQNIPTSILMRYDTSNQFADDFLGKKDDQLSDLLYTRSTKRDYVDPENMQELLQIKCNKVATLAYFRGRKKDATQLTLLFEQKVLDKANLSNFYDLKCTVTTYIRAQSNLIVAFDLRSPPLSNAINFYVPMTIENDNNNDLFLHSRDYLQREELTPKQDVLYEIYDLEARASINQGIIGRKLDKVDVTDNGLQQLVDNVKELESIWVTAIDSDWHMCRNFLQALQYVKSVTKNEFREEDKDDEEDNDEDKDEEQTLLQAIGTSIGNWFNPQNEEDDQKEVDEYNEELLEDARERRDKYNAETIQQDEIQRAVDAERQEGQLPNTLPEGVKKYFDNQQKRAKNRREDEKRKAFERERQKQETLANLKNGVRRKLAMPGRKHSRQIAALRRSDPQAAAQRSNMTTPVQFPHSESEFDRMFKEVELEDDDDDL